MVLRKIQGLFYPFIFGFCTEFILGDFKYMLVGGNGLFEDVPVLFELFDVSFLQRLPVCTALVYDVLVFQCFLCFGKIKVWRYALVCFLFAKILKFTV